MSNGRDGITDFIFGFLLGGVVGAGTALLLAPAKGKETRSIIHEKFNNVIEESGKGLDQVRDIVRQEVVKLASEKDALKDAFESGVETYKTAHAKPAAVNPDVE